MTINLPVELNLNNFCEFSIKFIELDSDSITSSVFIQQRMPCNIEFKTIT